MDQQVRRSPDEAPLHVRGYEHQLAAEGLIDSNNVGIVGFSRTVYHVMEALTKSSLPFRAASVTDGRNGGYLQDLTTVDSANGFYQKVGEAMIGAPPYGAGLQEWLKRSPEFNMDRVTAPLQVVTTPGIHIVNM